METPNKVSIWMGNFNSQEELDEYVEQKYDEDGDAADSTFMTNFLIDWYDHDFQEAFVRKEKTKNHELLLEGTSYSSSFIPQLLSLHLKEYNSGICLYDFEYNGKMKKDDKMDFIGVFKYNSNFD